MAKIPLPTLRARYARIATDSRRDADRAASEGKADIAAIHNGVAARAQAAANAISVALRAQHMARAA
jgi:hypothetical protein